MIHFFIQSCVIPYISSDTTTRARKFQVFAFPSAITCFTPNVSGRVVTFFLSWQFYRRRHDLTSCRPAVATRDSGAKELSLTVDDKSHLLAFRWWNHFAEATKCGDYSAPSPPLSFVDRDLGEWEDRSRCVLETSWLYPETLICTHRTDYPSETWKCTPTNYDSAKRH